MPFQSTTIMPPDPPIRIFFHGLIVVRSDDCQSCLIELLRDANKHKLSIEVRLKRRGKPDLILWRHLDKLSGKDPALRIAVTNPVDKPSVSKYVPISGLNPFVTDPTDENEQDFGWILNLSSKDYHARPTSEHYEVKPNLGVKLSGTRPGAVIKGGHCILYAASLVRSENTTMIVTQGEFGQDPRELKALAGLVGANLYFDDGRTVTITCEGIDGDLILEKLPLECEASYEIYIENTPLFEKSPPNDRHDELEEYYKVIRKGGNDGRDIPTDEQFRLKFTALGGELPCSVKGDPIVGSARIPCMSVVIDG